MREPLGDEEVPRQVEGILEGFSRYYDTVRALAASLVDTLSGEGVVIYEGVGYMHLQESARDVFEVRYERQINPDKDR